MKEPFRQAALLRRESMRAEERSRKSVLIQERLFSLPEFVHADALMTYVDFRNEVSTHGIIQKALDAGKRVVVPLSDFALKEITPCEIKSLDELSPNIFGIPEPKPEFVRSFPSNRLGLVIVPAVAFDECGNRLGYGKGFYDRFISGLNPLIPLIGLAFEFQVEKSVKCEPHDRPVHMIVTEKRVIACSMKKEVL